MRLRIAILAALCASPALTQSVRLGRHNREHVRDKQHNGHRAAACYWCDTSSTNVTVENNAISGCNQLIANGSPAPTSFTSIDYVYGGTVTGGNLHWNYASDNSSTLAGWQSACSCDAHSKATLGTAFAMSPEGVVLPGFIYLRPLPEHCPRLQTQPTAGNSVTGITRPTTGAWDAGAYQAYFDGGSGFTMSGGKVQ